MSKIGFVCGVKENNIVVHSLSYDLQVQEEDFIASDLNNYKLGDILVSSSDSLISEENIIYSSQRDGTDFSKVELDQLLYSLSVIIKLEYNEFLKHINKEKEMQEADLEKFYAFSVSEAYEEGSRKIIKISLSVNSLIKNLRDLHIIYTILKLANLEEKEKGVDYKNFRMHEEINLNNKEQERITIFQKVRRALTNRK